MQRPRWSARGPFQGSHHLRWRNGFSPSAGDPSSKNPPLGLWISFLIACWPLELFAGKDSLILEGWPWIPQKMGRAFKNKGPILYRNLN